MQRYRTKIHFIRVTRIKKNWSIFVFNSAIGCWPFLLLAVWENPLRAKGKKLKADLNTLLFLNEGMAVKKITTRFHKCWIMNASNPLAFDFSQQIQSNTNHQSECHDRQSITRNDTVKSVQDWQHDVIGEKTDSKVHARLVAFTTSGLSNLQAYL